MILDRRDDRRVKGDLFQDRCPDGRVDLCLFDLSISQRAGLVQNVVGYGKFADIMKQRARPERADLAFAQAEVFTYADGEDLCPSDVADPHLITSVYGGGKGLDRRKMNTTCL